MSAHSAGAQARSLAALKEDVVYVTETGQYYDLSQDWTYFRVKSGVTTITFPTAATIPMGLKCIIDNTANASGLTPSFLDGGSMDEIAASSMCLVVFNGTSAYILAPVVSDV